MQRERSSLDSFPDLNQGSIPMNTSPMDISSSWENMLSPVENRLSNYMLDPSDGNDTFMEDAANNKCQDFSSWDRGESSSSANNSRGGDDSKPNFGWPSSFFTTFEPSSNSGTTGTEALTMQNHSEGVGLNSNSGQTFYASSSNIGGFSDSSNAASSCKRKALEGTSNSNQNIMHHGHMNPGFASRGNLNIPSSGPLSSSLNNYSEHMNPTSNGVSMIMQPPLIFPSSPETSARNMTFSFRSNHGRNEPVPFNTPRSTSSSSSSSFSRNSSPITTYPNGVLNQSPHPVTLNEARVIRHPHPWNGSSFDSRTSAAVTNVRTSSSSRRINTPEYPNRDQIDWSFVPGNSNPSSSRSPSFSIPRVGPESSSSTWVPHQTNPNHQRLLERGSPWVVPLSSESESGNRRNHFVAHFPSSSEVGSSSRGQQRLDQRSTDLPGEGINRRSLAAMEGRHRLIRQVLTAMRRGGHQLQAEEYMFMDPFLSGFAELQDRHRDMRLDVDNMSYEELLALEDRIGNVSTGLSDEQIKSSMKQRRFDSIRVSPNMEPCCICQENYVNGDNIGILDCGHEFHTDCIKQWLTQKNICPICKTTGLET